MKSHFDYPEIYNADGTLTKLGRTLSLIAKWDSIEIPRKDVEGLIKLGFITYGLHPRGGYRASITEKGRKALTLADGYKVAYTVSDRSMSASRVSEENLHFERNIRRIEAAIDTLKAASTSSDVNLLPMAQELLDELKKAAGRIFPASGGRIWTLGGNDRPSVSLDVSAQPKEQWRGGIYENSDYARLMFTLDGRKGVFDAEYNSGNGLPRMRKFTFTDVDTAVRKFTQWANKAMASL